jgi:hypothetical protein
MAVSPGEYPGMRALPEEASALVDRPALVGRPALRCFPCRGSGAVRAAAYRVRLRASAERRPIRL